MKKLIAGAVVGVLMGAGLVTGTATTVSANPYAGTVNTTTNARATPATIRVNQTPRIRVNVRASQGNGTPRGPIRVTFSSRDGEVRRTFQRFYPGAPQTYGFPRLPRSARYVVTVTYIGYPNTVFRPSATATRLFVRNNRR